MKCLLNISIILAFLLSCGSGKKSGDISDPNGNNGNELPEKNTITVMTYNIHRGNPPGQAANVIDLKALANVILAQKPDLVSLNEVDVNTKRSGVNLDEAEELGRLTGMHAYFAKAMDYDGGQYGDAVLSKFPILESKRYALPFAISGSEPRSIAMIKVKVEDDFILFASTHLDHLGQEENRILQARTIVDEILPDLEYPLVIGGDLNALPESNTISILKNELTFGCEGTGCPLTFPYDNPDRSIDYIAFMPSNKFSFLSYKAIPNMIASDHLPLVAKIEIR